MRGSNTPTTEMTKTRKSVFSPWVHDMTRGGLFVAGGIGILAVEHARGGFGFPNFGPRSVLAVLSGLIIIIGYASFRSGYRRWFGKAVEKKATTRLRNITDTSVIMQSGVPVPPHAGGGDIDILIQSKNNTFAIEIKSRAGIEVQHSAFGGDRLIMTMRSKYKALPAKFDRDPFAQVINNAQYASAIPVLWFPMSKTHTTGTINGVKTVTGSPKQLCSALRIPTRSWLGNLF